MDSPGTPAEPTLTSFLGQSEPVLVWAGQFPPQAESVVHYPEGPDAGRKDLQGPQTISMDPEKASFYIFLMTPRLMSETYAWLEDRGRPRNDLQKALSAGDLIQVDPGSSTSALRAFAGYRLAVMGNSTGKIVESHPVTKTAEDGRQVTLPWLLASIIWQPYSIDHDIPEAAEWVRTEYETGLTGEETAELVLEALPRVLAGRYAWIEPVMQERRSSPLMKLFRALASFIDG